MENITVVLFDDVNEPSILSPVVFRRDVICITDQVLMQIQKSFVISRHFFLLFGINIIIVKPRVKKEKNK